MIPRGAALAGLLAATLLACGCGPAGTPERAPSFRGIILFIGDGMGLSTVTAARIHAGFERGASPPLSARLTVDSAPRTALVRTWAADRHVTDSAAGMTAMMTGRKAPYWWLGLARRNDGGTDTLETLLEIAEAMGLATGIVTTSRITHATPAGCYAHVDHRDREEEIALALLPGPQNPRIGDGVEVILGGGRRWLTPPPAGRRTDGRDLLAELGRAGYDVVTDSASLAAFVSAAAAPAGDDRARRSASPRRVIGLFSPDHMAYELDRPKAAPGEPSLAEMTRAALGVLAHHPSGFFLMVEGARIDHALHDGNAHRAVGDLLALDAALAEALRLAPPGTLILCTADHDHTLVVTGDAPIEADVFSIGGRDGQGRPYPTIVFGTGPGALPKLPDTLTAARVADPDFIEPSAIALKSGKHAATDVPLYAFGPPALLEKIPGTLDNTEIFTLMRSALEEEKGR